MSGLIEDLLSFCKGCKDDPLATPRTVDGVLMRWCPKFNLVMVKRDRAGWIFESGWSREDLRLVGRVLLNSGTGRA